MLSPEGYLDGITASIGLILDLLIGIYVIYRSKKIEAELLRVLGILIIFLGLVFLGVFFDFITVLSTGINIENIHGFVGLVSYIWMAPIFFLALYIGLDLKFPEKKWKYIRVFSIMIIIFEIIIFIDPYGSFIFTSPTTPGEMLIDYNLNLMSLAGILMISYVLFDLFFFGYTFFIHTHKTFGKTRRKFFFLTLGIFIGAIFGLLESLVSPGILLIFIRIGYVSGGILLYLGLKGDK